MHLVKAAGIERTSYIAMINIARILAPKRDDEEIIRQALQDVKDAIDDQRELKDDTFELDESENPNSDELSQQQADLVDRTDFIRQDVAELVPNAAQALGLSTDSQQEARAALSIPSTNVAAAAAQQASALESFENLEVSGNKLRGENRPNKDNYLRKIITYLTIQY